MGCQAPKREYFVSVSFDEYVPKNHLLRAVDHYLDLSEFRQHIVLIPCPKPCLDMTLPRAYSIDCIAALEPVIQAKCDAQENNTGHGPRASHLLLLKAPGSSSCGMANH